MDLTGPQTVAYDTGHGAVSLTNVRYNGAILVNQEGKRFANELGQTAALASAITKQTAAFSAMMMPSPVAPTLAVDGYPANCGLKRFTRSGFEAKPPVAKITAFA